MRVAFAGDLVTAIEQARAAVTHGHVVIMGGGDIIGPRSGSVPPQWYNVIRGSGSIA